MGFSKILVANRGEIAVRIFRTAKAMGYDTVAVFSEADAQAVHVSHADQAVCIGPPEPKASYLCSERILDAARATGADAIHPGYGFLSENAAFAQACQEAGLTFIGPPASAIAFMGNKSAAKRAMASAGVPCIPGYQEEGASDEKLHEEAKRIGFPLMVKAAAGGGGRGMRLVHEEAALAEALRSARSEAEGAFGSGELLIERALINPRHIEIQVFADQHGNAIHLGERDCSVQRRYQKVIEEAPSPALDEALRQAMGEAAVQAAKACNYVNAGTVEFLVDASREFYFLEMNTRLQVEHPVTELVTGLDLVAWQLRVADGEALPLAQEEVSMQGHAIEARLYAEDPARDYLPQTGALVRWEVPSLPGVRVDSGVEQGSVVSPHYDPMLAKLIVHAPTRRQACRLLHRALRETVALGVRNNKTFLRQIASHADFVAGEATTSFLTGPFADALSLSVQPPEPRACALAALLFYLQSAQSHLHEREGWRGWRSASRIDATMSLTCGETRLFASVHAEGDGALGRRYQITCWHPKEEPKEDQGPHAIEVVAEGAQELTYVWEGVQERLAFAFAGDTLHLNLDGLTFTNTTGLARSAQDQSGSGIQKAPIDGAVTALFVAEGDTVTRGQLLLVMDAMKMEHQILADVDGVVAKVNARVSEQVKLRQLLIQITPAEESTESAEADASKTHAKEERA